MSETETLDLKRLRTHPAVREAERCVRAHDERTVRLQMELTEIPAPPFGEHTRGERVAELFREVGLRDVDRDEAGNVLGRLPGSGGGAEAPTDEPPAVLSAHLDTVFPPDVDVGVRRTGDLLEGPGIADNGRGLAALLAVARALVDQEVRTPAPLVFAATVGEEGAGDLRGVRHLFRPDSPLAEASAFISLDGAGLETLVVRGIGCVRLRAVARGVGGHSWADRGRVNPMAGLGRGVAALAKMEPPAAPPSSLTVTRWGGGTGINAIPQEAWIEVDVRSEGREELDALHREAVRRLEGALRAEESRRGSEGERLELSVEVIGDRPVAAMDPAHPLVDVVQRATRMVGASPRLVASSTDANVPMARGVPALAMGAGGKAGGSHTLQEWFRNERGAAGVVRALLVALGAAGGPLE